MYTYVFSYNSYMYNLSEYTYNVYVQCIHIMIYVHIFENVREYISVHLYIKFT